MDSIRRESDGKPSNSLAKRKTYELYSASLPPYRLTRSHFLAFLYQFFDLVGRGICDRYIIIVINTPTRFHLLVSKSRWSTNNIFMKEKRMKSKWLTSIFDALDKLLPRLSIFRAKMCAFPPLPSSKIFLKMTEHSWTKTTLSRGGRRKLFNSSLLNKLI